MIAKLTVFRAVWGLTSFVGMLFLLLGIGIRYSVWCARNVPGTRAAKVTPMNHAVTFIVLIALFIGCAYIFYRSIRPVFRKTPQEQHQSQ